MSAAVVSLASPGFWAGLEPVAGPVVKATLLLAAGWLVCRAAAGASAALRHLVWSATLVSLLALVPASLAPVALELPWLPAPPAPTAEHRAASDDPDAPLTASGVAAAVESAASPTRPAVESGRQPPSLPIPAAILGGVYSAGVALTLAHLLLGVGRIRRLTRSAEPAERDEAWRELAEATPRTRKRGSARLLVSESLPVPATWGLLRPVVLLPAGAGAWETRQRRWALLHELAHVERRDWAIQTLARVACALFWFHPLAWLAARRLALEAERASDDRVLAAGADSGSYADQLLSLARRLGRAEPLAAVPMARGSQLHQRIHSILDPRSRRFPMSRSMKSAVLVLTLVPMLAVASAELVPAEGAAAEASRAVVSEPSRPVPAGARAATARGGPPQLLVAAAEGDLAAVDRLLAGGADPNLTYEGPGRDGALLRSPLATAARAGELEVVRRLLAAGAGVDRTPRGDASPLMEAAGHGHLDVVELLLAHGAEIDRVVRGDGTALIAAARGGHPEIVGYLLDRGADPDLAVRGDASPLFHAAGQGDVGSIEKLVAAGADVDRGVRGDGNALIAAARHGQPEAVDALVAAGADVDAAVEGDGNALIVAAARGDTELVRRLLAAGGDVDAAVRGDGNPLIAAAREGHVGIVRILLDAGADVDRVVPGDENALIQAAGGGHLEVVRVLIAAGADVHARVPAGGGRVRTALGQALRGGHDNVAELLRTAGATE